MNLKGAVEWKSKFSFTSIPNIVTGSFSGDQLLNYTKVP